MTRPINEAAVQAALGRVLASPCFARADRASRLLRYLVEQSLAGKSAEIKESVIAIDVFARRDYDPRIDSVVRVEAYKIRSLLQRYYQSEGASDQVQIDIPKGSYVPHFEARSAPARKPGHRARSYWIAAALFIVAAAVGVWTAIRHRPVPAPGGPFTLAVLPFVDMSPSADQGALCDGLSEELTATLAGVEGMRVAARTSAFRYRNDRSDIRRIGRELDVRAILEGSVRREGNRIRVTAQLIQADDGFHLWQQTYDREFHEILEVQKDIADAVARSFHLDLSRVTRALVRPRPANADAWHYYLRANAVFDSGSERALEQSMALLEQAVASDPRYALGWAKMAQTQILLAEGGFRPFRDALRDAGDYGQRALELSPSLAECQHVGAKIKLLGSRDWKASEELFRRAVELDPSSTEIRYDFAHLVLVPLGRFAEAEGELRRGLATDPLRISLKNELGSMYIKSRRFDLARAELEQVRRIAPDAPGAAVLLGMAESAQGRYEQALSFFEEAARLRRMNWVLGHMGYAHAGLERHEQARAVLAELRQRRPLPLVEIAAVAAGMGDRATALTSLERADADQFMQLLWLRVDFRFASLASEDRYRRLLRRIHLQ